MTAKPVAPIERFIRKVADRYHDQESDRDLLRRFAQQRDEDAFAALVRRHGAMVRGVGLRVLRRHQDAEDVCQATFLLLARKVDVVPWRDSVANWLYGAAYHLALQARDSAKRRNAHENKVRPKPPPDALADIALRELQTILDEELTRLPNKYRAAILLCCLEGKARDEAAQCLGWTLATMKSRLEEGRELLRRRLARRGLTLSATLAAVTLTSAGAQAALPAALVHATSRAALQVLAGQTIAGVVSANVMALLQAGAQTIAVRNLKIATAIVLMIGALGLGAGVLAERVLGVPPAAAASHVPPAPVAEDRAGSSTRAAFHSEKTPDAPQGPDAKDAGETVILRGQVLDPGGKPLAGAKLYVSTPKKAEPVTRGDTVVTALGATDADGRFSVTTKLPRSLASSYLIAHAAGFGVDWIDLGEHKPSILAPLPEGKGKTEMTLRLAKEVPITGRVVNTEGKAVAGVSVSAIITYIPADDKLDDYLAGWLTNMRDAVATPRKRLYAPLDRITGAVITDKEGKFTLRGAGSERIVHVTFAGAGIARSTPYVITRPGFDPRPYNDVLLRKEHADFRSLNRFLGMVPPDMVFIAEAGRTVTGVVKDRDTGKPLPGCRLYGYMGWSDGVVVVSDENGAYRIDGFARNARGYSVSVTPPAGQDYLGRSGHAVDTAGVTPLALDIELVKGVVVRGRVVDKQTGQGVSAGVRFAPMPDNKFFGSKPGYDNYRSDGTMADVGQDGRFRLVTIPGKALVMAQAHGGREKVHGQDLSPYRKAVPDPDHLDLFKYDKDDDTWLVTTAENRLEFLSVESAVKIIDVKEDGSTNVELVVDRGVTGKIAVQDTDGKPLPGAWVAGLTDQWPITYQLPEALLPVLALNPEKPRTLAIYHAEKKLGGTVTVRGDEKEPVVAKLEPLARVTGRLLDTDGQPLSGAEISVNAFGLASELYRFANPPGKLPVTDKEGRFTLTGVVPGISFYMGIRKEETYYRGKPKIGLRQLKARETLDLGDQTVEPRP